MEYDNGLKKTVKLNYFNYQNRFLKKIGLDNLLYNCFVPEKSEQIWSFPLFDEALASDQSMVAQKKIYLFQIA